MGLEPPSDKSIAGQESTLRFLTSADMEHDAVLHPPDFPIAADGLRRAADQLERCAHLPAVDGGVHTMQMMQALMERFDRLEHNMRRGFADLGERMEALDQKVTIS